MTQYQISKKFSKRRKTLFPQRHLCFGLCLLMLASCNTSPKVDPLAGGGGLSGSWRSADNVFTAQLDNGRFISTANDTGAVLSEGQYVVISASEVRLTWRGNLSKQDNAATCLRQGAEAMNCTDQAGRTFALLKNV